MLILKHSQEIKALTEEVNLLKNVINLIAIGLAKASQEQVTIIDNAEKVKYIESNKNEASSTPVFKCEHCE